MNIAIDLGTSFTYVGTWYNGKFIPLIYGQYADRDFKRFGYPTTIQTVSLGDGLEKYKCRVEDSQGSAIVECFTGRGMTDIKKAVLDAFVRNKNLDYKAALPFAQRGFWFEHSNGLVGSPENAFRAFFEVLLNLTCEAVKEIHQNEGIFKQNETLDKIILCFPITNKGVKYEELLTASLVEACQHTEWTENAITRNDIYIKSENQCITSAISSLETVANEKLLVIDIGGATSDYCIKNPKKMEDEKSVDRNSTFNGVSQIDEEIRNTLFKEENEEQYRNDITNVMLAKFKEAIEIEKQGTLSIKGQNIVISKTMRLDAYNNLGQDKDRNMPNVWQRTFGPVFDHLIALARCEKVGKIVLTGGGSKISNIKAQAKAVFSEEVTTIENLAEENHLKGELTANNGVCYGAALLLDQILKETTKRKNPPPAPPVPPKGNDKEEKDDHSNVHLGHEFGLGTCDYDIRFQCRDEKTKEWELMLFVKKGTNVQNPVYSKLEEFKFETKEAADIKEFRKGILKEMGEVSEKQFVPIDSSCADLPLRECDEGVIVENGTKEYIGVIACKGISAMYFVVATYARQDITSGDKTYKEGTLINRAWFSRDPLPPDVLLNAPTTKEEYDAQYKRQKEQAEKAEEERKKQLKEQAEKAEEERKRKLKEQAEKEEEERKKQLKEQAKQDAKEELRKLHNEYLKKLGSGWHPVKKQKLNKLKDTYSYKIHICDDESKLKKLLEEAEEEFRGVL